MVISKVSGLSIIMDYEKSINQDVYSWIPTTSHAPWMVIIYIEFVFFWVIKHDKTTNFIWGYRGNG